MSLIEEALYTRGQSQAGLTALISTRMWPERLKQSPTYPAIAYRLVTAPREYSLAGSSGLVGARFQLDVYAATYASAKAVVEQVRLAFESFRGTVDAIRIQEITLEGVIDITEPRSTEPTQPIRHVAVDILVWYEETKT